MLVDPSLALPPPCRFRVAMPTVKQLQAALKAKGLDTKGKKAELEQRLADAEQEEAAPAPKAAAAPAPAPPPKETEPEPAAPPAAAAAAASEPASSRKRKAAETPAAAAPSKAVKVAKKAAPKAGGKAAVTEWRQEAYGKYETHTQYASAAAQHLLIVGLLLS
jgi:hypothetical protein